MTRLYNRSKRELPLIQRFTLAIFTLGMSISIKEILEQQGKIIKSPSLKKLILSLLILKLEPSIHAREIIKRQNRYTKISLQILIHRAVMPYFSLYKYILRRRSMKKPLRCWRVDCQINPATWIFYTPS